MVGWVGGLGLHLGLGDGPIAKRARTAGGTDLLLPTTGPRVVRDEEEEEAEEEELWSPVTQPDTVGLDVRGGGG